MKEKYKTKPNKKKTLFQSSIEVECNKQTNVWAKVQSNDIKLNKIAIAKVKKIARNLVAHTAS